MTDIHDTLNERGKRYGAFDEHARITQKIKRTIFANCRDLLSDDQTEALEMIAHKLGRIVNGDPNYADSWVDIAGYATLVADRLLLAESTSNSQTANTIDANARGSLNDN
jgi:hypothetical protein